MDQRHTLAALISGQDAERPSPSEAEVAQWIALAREEGVVGLLAERLRPSDRIPAWLRDPLVAQVRQLAMMELGQHAALCKVLACLQAAAIPVLVLKGTALRCWLYPAPHLRESSDIDLLFASRAQAMLAVAALEPLGYGVAFQPDRFAHELLCRHAGAQVDLDLHWALTRHPALNQLPDFSRLLAGSVPLAGLSPAAHGLGPVDALLHACVHRASNLEVGVGDRLKWLYDIHLLATTLADGAWSGFVRACVEARVCGIALSALEASSSLFATVVPDGTIEALRARIVDDAIDADRLHDWRHMQWQGLHALPDWRARTAWTWLRMFPSSGYMRELYGRDLSRTSLLRHRLLSLLGRFR